MTCKAGAAFTLSCSHADLSFTCEDLSSSHNDLSFSDMVCSCSREEASSECQHADKIVASPPERGGEALAPGCQASAPPRELMGDVSDVLHSCCQAGVWSDSELQQGQRKRGMFMPLAKARALEVELPGVEDEWSTWSRSVASLPDAWSDMQARPAGGRAMGVVAQGPLGTSSAVKARETDIGIALHEDVLSELPADLLPPPLILAQRLGFSAPRTLVVTSGLLASVSPQPMQGIGPAVAGGSQVGVVGAHGCGQVVSPFSPSSRRGEPKVLLSPLRPRTRDRWRRLLQAAPVEEEEQKNGEGEGHGIEHKKGEGGGHRTEHKKGEGDGHGTEHKKGEGDGQGTEHKKGEGDGQGTEHKKGEGDGQGTEQMKGEGGGYRMEQGLARGCSENCQRWRSLLDQALVEEDMGDYCLTPKPDAGTVPGCIVAQSLPHLDPSPAPKGSPMAAAARKLWDIVPQSLPDLGGDWGKKSGSKPPKYGERARSMPVQRSTVVRPQRSTLRAESLKNVAARQQEPGKVLKDKGTKAKATRSPSPRPSLSRSGITRLPGERMPSVPRTSFARSQSLCQKASAVRSPARSGSGNRKCVSSPRHLRRVASAGAQPIKLKSGAGDCAGCGCKLGKELLESRVGKVRSLKSTQVAQGKDVGSNEKETRCSGGGVKRTDGKGEQVPVVTCLSSILPGSFCLGTTFAQ